MTNKDKNLIKKILKLEKELFTYNSNYPQVIKKLEEITLESNDNKIDYDGIHNKSTKVSIAETIFEILAIFLHFKKLDDSFDDEIVKKTLKNINNSKLHLSKEKCNEKYNSFIKTAILARKSENVLIGFVDEFFRDLTLYDDKKKLKVAVKYHYHSYKSFLHAAIRSFLIAENRETAFDVYTIFFDIYRITDKNKSEDEFEKITPESNLTLELIDTLKHYELRTGHLVEKQRDHYIHSVNVFILGIAIYIRSKKFQKIFKDYVSKSKYEKPYRTGDNEMTDEEFLYRWGIASLFHDLGYPVEIIVKQLNKFLDDTVNKLNSYKDDEKIKATANYNDFSKINSIKRIHKDFTKKFKDKHPETLDFNMFRPTNILAHELFDSFKDELKMKNFDIFKIKSVLSNYLKTMEEGDFIDHGFYSSLMLLSWYGFLIQEFSKDYNFFFYPIVDSSCAILLHNFYGGTLQRKPFDFEPLKPETHPLGFLLILCDHLQEWNREAYGKKDIEKTHPKYIDLKITDDEFYVKYLTDVGIVNSEFRSDLLEEIVGSDKTNKIIGDMPKKDDKKSKGLLNIDSLFSKNFDIVTNTADENILKNHQKRKDYSKPERQLISITESLAIIIHENYVKQKKEDLNKKIKILNESRASEEEIKKIKIIDKEIKEIKDEIDNLEEDFNKLSDDFKYSNYRAAKAIPENLNVLGYEMVEKESDERKPITSFSPEEIELLAEIEHENWKNERENLGWTYGEEKDEDKKISPWLVPWAELGEKKIKEYDRKPIENIPKNLEKVGMKIVRKDLKDLAILIHNEYVYYCKKNKIPIGNENFEDLPEYIQLANYEEAFTLPSILSSLGFEIVDKSDSKEAVELTEENVEQIARKKHCNWYKNKKTEGWNYGPIKDFDKKENPYVVPWDPIEIEYDGKKIMIGLEKEAKDALLHTQRKLPELLDKIQFKIVKKEKK
ncbi:MAG: RyR domain-containing protein [Methanobrevibacter sp.]|nr:RyR domain-containing protein [Methanobrevibacter sp.]